MSFQYTQTTLQDALKSFLDDRSPEFIAALPDIIRLGEARLAKRLDLDSLDSTDTVQTAASSAEVVKPANLVVDRLIIVNLGDRKQSVHRRSRAWVELFNVDGELGEPKYYCELDEERWLIGPLASQIWTLTVHGYYRPVSIMGGAPDGTTWFSERVPELLLLACSIDALEFLKFWSKKAAQEADFEAQAASWLKMAAPLQRSDVEDILGNRMNANKPDTQVS